MEFEQILTLVSAVSDSELTEFKLEQQEFKLTMNKKKKEAVFVNAGEAPHAVEMHTEAKESNKETGNVQKSPLVGTFYNAASPEEEPFVKVGDSVKKGQTLGIIEAMKLMNEIECEYDGVLKEILVENQAMVEYGQSLFVIE